MQAERARPPDGANMTELFRDDIPATFNIVDADSDPPGRPR